jgi:thioesterase domain-containing protein/acyl carrier protein
MCLSNIDFATAITRIEGGSNHLLAYFLAKSGVCVPTVEELRKHLLGRLPDYMVPETFVRLHKLPLSPNGKLDLTALPQPTNENVLERTSAKMPGRRVEEKLITIVRELLENDGLRVEDNFFLAGGNSLLSMRLLMCVREAFGVDLTLRQLLEAPTVQQLALLVGAVLEQSALPPGVVGPQLDGTVENIFWVHYQSIELSRVMGKDRPIISVTLTAEDLTSLGEMPSVPSIAACLRRKILAKQSKGPYIIGGFCLGGILGYEIASQLWTAGHKVSLLVLLNAPNPAYLESCDSLTRKVRYLCYALRRAARLGLRTSLVYLGQHLSKRLTRLPNAKSTRTEMSIVQEISEAAIFKYQPGKYEGKVLLLLASDRAPHANFLSGWQAVVRDLHIRYLDGHHRDLLTAENVGSVRDAIASQLIPASDEGRAGANGSMVSGKNAEPAGHSGCDKYEVATEWRCNIDPLTQ